MDNTAGMSKGPICDSCSNFLQLMTAIQDILIQNGPKLLLIIMEKIEPVSYETEHVSFCNHDFYLLFNFIINETIIVQ